MTKQIFGSSLKYPWALVEYGSNSPVGKRPGTSVAFLTDDEGGHYLGGEVELYRSKNEPSARWHYRYQKAKRIPKAKVLHVFELCSKSPWGGPTEQGVRRARKALPVTTAERYASEAA